MEFPNTLYYVSGAGLEAAGRPDSSTALSLFATSLGLEIFGFPTHGFGLGLAVALLVGLGEVFDELNHPRKPEREVLALGWE